MFLAVTHIGFPLKGMIFSISQLSELNNYNLWSNSLSKMPREMNQTVKEKI